MGEPSTDPAIRLAFQRLVDAINAPQDAALLAAAVVDGVQVARHVPGEGATAIAERFDGIAALAKWFARTPPRTTFALVGEPWLDGADAAIKYSIAIDDFYNEGIWRATVGSDGRITRLSHHPFALREPG